MLPFLRSLRAVIDACDVPVRQLHRTLVRHQARLHASAVALCRVDPFALDETVLDLFIVDGTVPSAALELLSRVLGSDRSITSTPPPLEAAEAVVVNALTHVFVAFLNALMRYYNRLDCAAPALLPLLASLQPCRTLALALIAGTPSTLPPPTAPGSPSENLVQMAALAALAATLMTSLVGLSVPFGAALGPQLATSGLLPLMCDTLSRQLPDGLRQVTTLAHAFQALSASSAGKCDWEGCAGPHGPVLFAALAAEPAFESLMVKAAGVRQPPEAHRQAVCALYLWQTVNDTDGAPASQVDAQALVDLAQAMHGSGGGPFLADNLVLFRLYQRLQTHAEKQRAFPALAAHAERSLARALSPTLAEVPLLDDDGGGCGDLMMHFFSSSSSLPTVFLLPASYMDGTHPEHAVKWESLRTCARQMRRRGTLASVEALLRQSSRNSVKAIALPGELELRGALDAAVLLADDPQHGPAAFSACLSALGTQRKVLVRWAHSVAFTQAGRDAAAAIAAADAPSGAATAAAATPTDGSLAGATSASADGLAAGAGAVSRAHEAALTSVGRPAQDGATAADTPGPLAAPVTLPIFSNPCSTEPLHSVLAGCVTVLSLLTKHKPLRAMLQSGCSAAQTLLRCAVLQLLPLTLNVATQQLRLQQTLDHAAWASLLQLLLDLHTWGLADLTAAAGAPPLLLRLLSALHPDDPQASGLLELAARAVEQAGTNAAWLREVARLSLLVALAACAEALRSAALAGALGTSPLHGFLPDASALQGGAPVAHAADAVAAPMVWICDFLVSDALEGILASAELHTRACQESGILASAAATPTWDSCALALLMEPEAELPGGGGARVRPLLGCCCRRCVNLVGPSEAALRLRRCGGCRLAAYCSAACQRKAWRTGHRAACLDWQRVGLELAVYDEE